VVTTKCMNPQRWRMRTTNAKIVSGPPNYGMVVYMITDVTIHKLYFVLVYIKSPFSQI